MTNGFVPECNAEIMENHLVQIYVNQTAVDYYNKTGIEHSGFNPYPFYLFPSLPELELKGIILVHAQIQYVEDPHQSLQASYKNMLETNGADPEFLERDDRTYVIFSQGPLSVVDVAIGQEHYRVIGMIPRGEVLEIAESLGR
jgi:hypothetical protein